MLKTELKKIHLKEKTSCQLIYLTQVSDSKHLPFSEEACSAFKKAHKTRMGANLMLKAGLAGTTVLTVIPLISALPPVFSWAQESTENNLKLVMIIVVIAVVANLVNFIATGTVPDLQTSAAEKRQIFIFEAKKDYENMAISLLALKILHPEIASIIASNIDIPKLRFAMEKALLAEKRVSEITIDDNCKPLETAISIILKGKLPKTPWAGLAAHFYLNKISPQSNKKD